MKNGGLHQVEDEECVADRLFGRVHPDDVVPHAVGHAEREGALQAEGEGPKAHPVPGPLTTEGINKAQSAPLYRYTKRQRRAEDPGEDLRRRGDKAKEANFGERLCGRREQDCPGRQEEKDGPRGTNPLDPTYKLPTSSRRPHLFRGSLSTTSTRLTSRVSVLHYELQGAEKDSKKKIQVL